MSDLPQACPASPDRAVGAARVCARLGLAGAWGSGLRRVARSAWGSASTLSFKAGPAASPLAPSSTPWCLDDRSSVLIWRLRCLA